jgi:hypothetical protein
MKQLGEVSGNDKAVAITVLFVCNPTMQKPNYKKA